MKFHRQEKKAALISDNCQAHLHIENIRAVKLAFLPTNITSKTQPMDQGVMQAL